MAIVLSKNSKPNGADPTNSISSLDIFNLYSGIVNDLLNNWAANSGSLTEAQMYGLLNKSGTYAAAPPIALFETITGNKQPLADLLVSTSTKKAGDLLDTIATRLLSTGLFSAANLLESIKGYLIDGTSAAAKLSAIETVLNYINTSTDRTVTGIQAPQDITGNTEVKGSDLSRSASGTIATVTATKTGYLHSFSFIGKSTGEIRCRLRDGNGGTVLYNFLITAGNQWVMPFPIPVKFTTGLYLDLVVVSGAMTYLDTAFHYFEK